MRQEDECKFETILNYIGDPSLKEKRPTHTPKKTQYLLSYFFLLFGAKSIFLNVYI